MSRDRFPPESGTLRCARPHEHVWDTETDEFSTFTPDPGLDGPWVIHECIEVGCLAIKVTRVLRNRPVEIVYEEASDRG